MANYLYNGVELPELPEWDKVTYPYAIIQATGNGSTTTEYGEPYVLVVTSVKRTYSGTQISSSESAGNYYQATYNDSDGKWGEMEPKYTKNALTTGLYKAKPIWANHDVYLSYKTSIYLAASDPQPIKTAFVYDKASFLAGLAAGLCGRGVGDMPVPMCYYNETMLPPLPEYDHETYPYAIIHVINSARSQLTVCREKPYWYTDEDGTRTFELNGAKYDWATYTKPYIWDDWGAREEDYSGSMDAIWTNFDLYNEDGTEYMLASEPVPTSLPYVVSVLYYGAVTTADDGNGIYVSESISSDNADSLSSTIAYRVMIDGVTTIENRGGSNPSYYLGNPYLYKPDSYEDNGGSWCIMTSYSYTAKVYSYILYTRNAGTYKLKIESVRG